MHTAESMLEGEHLPRAALSTEFFFGQVTLTVLDSSVRTSASEARAQQQHHMSAAAAEGVLA